MRIIVQITLHLKYQNIGVKGLTEEKFKTFVDSYVEGITKSDKISTARVNKNEISKKDDFWLANLDVKGEMAEEYRHFMMRLMYDDKTGIMYTFAFIQKESISEENQKYFEKTLSSITLRQKKVFYLLLWYNIKGDYNMKKRKTIVIASNNEHKIKEFKELLPNNK